MNINHWIRYKENIPFSISLTKWVRDEYNKLLDKEIVIETTTIEYEYDYLKQYFDDNKVLIISTNNCSNNIFGNEEDNVMFRAIHDYVHYMYDLKFTLEDELKCCVIQQQTISLDNLLDRELLFSEIVGQALYYDKYNSFPTNQRKFTIDFLSKRIL